MLTTRFEKITGHPAGDVFHFDLVDPEGPSGRGLNHRHQIRLEGVRAIWEACGRILSGEVSMVELMESPGGGPYLREERFVASPSSPDGR